MSLQTESEQTKPDNKEDDDVLLRCKQIIGSKPPGAKHIMREMILQFAQGNASYIAEHHPIITGSSILLEMAPHVDPAKSKVDVAGLKKKKSKFQAEIEADHCSQVVEKTLEKHLRGRVVSKIICWGLGSMTEESTARSDSLWQLVMLDMIGEKCARLQPKAGKIQMLQQDPIFSQADIELLKEYGHVVLHTPAGYAALEKEGEASSNDAEVILVAPHFNPLYFPHQLLTSPPAIIICNSITEELIDTMPSFEVMSRVQSLLAGVGEGDIIGGDLHVKDNVRALFYGTDDKPSVFEKGSLFLGPETCWEAYHGLHYYIRKPKVPDGDAEDAASAV